MKFIDEFRDPALARKLVAQIHHDAARRAASHPIRLMEFCGGHTHAISRFGLRELLTPAVELRSGPGCPVCVTAAADLDRAIALADAPGVILATFGDMVRVPGSRRQTLQAAAARGADIRIVYSPLDALDIARQQPQREVVFLGVGFETTAPGIAAALLQAETEGTPNFSVLSLHKLTPPAMRAILEAGEVALEGIIGPGHVSAVIGSAAWEFLPREYAIPCAVAGFEPLDILSAIGALVQAVVAGEPAVVNTYARGVRAEGNPVAQQLLARVFEVGPADWRGFGAIANSGLTLRESFAHRDAARLFPVEVASTPEPPGCRCGDVLRGVIAPTGCALFRRVCSPRNPIGPCMVSAEGACAAYFQYERWNVETFERSNVSTGA
ncbi:MAG TPA: hydrogenase formation protein HypD [Anaerolineae bacterium]|nr:hydrogenase formation protein HypD [Anaerolineae bacterium]HQI87387.1 hydrogenase formation protein HypD [Anaerolineae bacterium]